MSKQPTKRPAKRTTGRASKKVVSKPFKPRPLKKPAKSTLKKDSDPWIENALKVTVEYPKAVEVAAQKQVAKKALIITEEATRHVNLIRSLVHADVGIEKAAMAFRAEVIKAGLKEAHDLLDPMVEAAKVSYDTARAQRDKACAPFENADKEIRDTMAGYLGMLQHQQIEAQRQVEREQADREIQAAQQREAERTRVQAEVDEQLAALPTEGLSEEEARAIESLAEKIMARLEEFDGPQPIAPKVQVSAPEVSGSMTLAPNWKARVTNVMAVVKLVVAGVLPEALIEIREPEANKLAKLYQDKRSFDGLEFYNQPFARGVGGRK